MSPEVGVMHPIVVELRNSRLRRCSSPVKVLITEQPGLYSLVKYLTIPVLLFLLAASLLAPAPLESDDQASDELIQRYVAQAQLQQDRLKGVQMDMDIDARLPKLQKTGR